MIKVTEPATSANIGPGFDSLGLALNISNTYSVEEIDEGLVIEGCDLKYANQDNLTYLAMIKCFEKVGYKPKGIKIVIESDIPVARGLGSSATCIVGGLIAANKISGCKLNKDELLDMATEMEGHPDNVAPALLGGMVVSVHEDKVYYSKIKVAPGIKFLALIPDFELSTKKARSILPKVIPHSDAVFNVGRVALMVSALQNGEFDLLKVAGQDKLHQHYRGTLINGYEEILNKSMELDAKCVFLSGAGPTILVAVDQDDNEIKENLREFLDKLRIRWEIKELKIDQDGAKVREG